MPRQTQSEHAAQTADRYRKTEEDEELTETLKAQLSATRATAIDNDASENLAGSLLAVVPKIGGKGMPVPRTFALINEIAIQEDHRSQGNAFLLM